MSERWVSRRAERLFNLYVGIDQVVNLGYDKQLEEAIRIITAGEIEKYLAPPVSEGFSEEEEANAPAADEIRTEDMTEK